MPVTTFLRQSEIFTEYPFALNDTELSDLLQELRESTSEDWVIIEESVEQKRWFKKILSYKYRLLKKLNGGEYQEIQFYRPNEDFVRSIGTGVHVSVVAAYIVGLLAGLAR